MALTKSKITVKAVGDSIRKALKPKPEPFPDFSGKLPYSPNPKRKTFRTMPYELPEKPDPNLRTPADQLRPEIKRIGASKMPGEKEYMNRTPKASKMPGEKEYMNRTPKSTDDLRYKQPDWLTKILNQPGNENKNSTFRDSLKSWMQSMRSQGRKAVSMKPRTGLTTGRKNQDSQLNKID